MRLFADAVYAEEIEDRDRPHDDKVVIGTILFNSEQKRAFSPVSRPVRRRQSVEHTLQGEWARFAARAWPPAVAIGAAARPLIQVKRGPAGP